jgi:hypothetical protein
MTIKTYVNSLSADDRETMIEGFETLVDLGSEEFTEPLTRRLRAVKRRISRINGFRDEVGTRLRRLRQSLTVLENNQPRDPEARLFREMLRGRIKTLEILLNMLYPKDELKVKVALSTALETAQEQGSLCARMLRFIEEAEGG